MQQVQSLIAILRGLDGPLHELTREPPLSQQSALSQVEHIAQDAKVLVDAGPDVALIRCEDGSFLARRHTNMIVEKSEDLRI